jgi:hypothetical protein
MTISEHLSLELLRIPATTLCRCTFEGTRFAQRT